MKIIQLAHGRIIPKHSSAYSLRCHRYLNRFSDRKLFSVGGLIFLDKIVDYAHQYKSLLMTGASILSGSRSLEIYISNGKFLRRKYIKEVSREISNADIVIFEGPWQYRLFKDQLYEKKVVYDAHNVEYILRDGNKWQNFTKGLEAELASRADLIITFTSDDKQKISELYGINPVNIEAIPDGFEPNNAEWNGLNSREISFIGSAYMPNVEAANHIAFVATKLRDFHFNIIGSVCSVLKRRDFPNNVSFLGTMDEVEKNKVLRNSILALNPATRGSGRNTKVLDYISNGVPVVTSKIGARGFEHSIVDNFFISEPEETAETIRYAVSDQKNLLRISSFFRKYAREHSYSQTENATFDAITKLFTVNGF